MEIRIKPNDDPQFVELVSRMISGIVTDKFPEEIFVTHIDNWFDHKWLNFSGIGRVGFFGTYRDTALDPSWQDKITFPPFSPKRIIEKYYTKRDETGDFPPLVKSHYLHPKWRASSCENLHKRVADYADSALFVWFSSNTNSNGRGSIMVYEARGGVYTWYISLSKSEEWGVVNTKGITREQFQSLIEKDVLQGRT
jgi:hypothetical protein